MQIAVIGAGAWGCALAYAISQTTQVKLWARDAAQVANLTQERYNPNCMASSTKFNHNVTFTHDLSQTLTCDLLVMSVPVNALSECLSDICKKAQSRNLTTIPDLILTCKGVELNSGLLPHQLAEKILQQYQFANVNTASLLGPSFAKDVINGLPTLITLAGNNSEFVLGCINSLKGIKNFRIYANSDIVGAEVGAAVKNVLAIATGISDGLNLGYNARAALITRGLSELCRLIIAMGGDESTAYGLTGIGDLVLTCTGDLSRNRSFGMKVAQGLDTKAVLSQLNGVAEGVYTTKIIYRVGQNLNHIIYEHRAIAQVITELLNREVKFENS
jgi:glycerol-3-phosphate dehydrogenase (NAD(P)+)